MQDNKINTNKLKVSKFVYLIVFFLFLVFIVSLTYSTLVDYKAKGNLTISEFINNRNTVEETILPERGTIYDTLGNPLAQDVSSYTIIAYLDESRSKDSKNLRHVKDKEKTAKELSPILNMTEEKLIELLNKKLYQVHKTKYSTDNNYIQDQVLKKPPFWFYQKETDIEVLIFYSSR